MSKTDAWGFSSILIWLIRLSDHGLSVGRKLNSVNTEGMIHFLNADGQDQIHVVQSISDRLEIVAEVRTRTVENKADFQGGCKRSQFPFLPANV